MPFAQASTPGRQQHAAGRLTSSPPPAHYFSIMPNWHATVRGNVLHLVHSTPDDELDRVGSWEITLWRGAPSWESDPELEHAALGTMLPELHKPYIRHAWQFDIPDRYLGASNTGDERQWMTLQGGSWQIVLRFPLFTPSEVFRAVAAGFHAQMSEPSTPPAGVKILPQADYTSLLQTEANRIVKRLTPAARAAL